MDRSISIKQAVEDNKSIREIAIEEGVSPNTISYWLSKLGLKTSRAKGANGKRPPKQSLLGKQFDMLEVIELVQEEKTGVWLNICRCSCGNITKPLPNTTLLRKTTTSCGCRRDQYEKLRGANSTQWRGYQEISGNYWSKLKRGAKNRGHTFVVTKQEVWELFIQQDRKCALSGRDIIIGKSASLDRIDPLQGYVLSNLQWVHRDINYAKHILQQDAFIKLCKEVIKYHEQNK